MAGAGTTIYDAMTKMSPEAKQALVASIKDYGDAPTSLESVGRAFKGIATDPTTYATGGVGALITKTLGKKAAEQAVVRAALEGVNKQLLSQGTKQALATGAGYGAANNALEQGVQMAADGQDEFDFAKLGRSAAVGAGLGAGVNKVIDKVLGRTAVRTLGQKSGSEADLLTNAEIIQQVAKEAESPSRAILDGLPKLQRKEVNARVTGDIIREAKDIISSLPNDYPNKAALLAAANRGTGNSQRELEALAQIQGGPELVEVINKAIRADRLTAPNASSQNFLIRGARTLADYALPGVVSKPIQYMLKPRSSSEDVVNKLINKWGPAAEKVAELGVDSPGTKAIATLQEMAQEAAARATAERAARSQTTRATAAKAADNPNAAISELMGKDPTYLLSLSNQFGAPRNATEMTEFSKVIKSQMEARLAKEKLAQEAASAAKGATPAAERNAILEATGMPLGGPFQELLQGGRSGLNLTTEQAVEALRIAAAKNRDNPIGTAANQIRRSSEEGVTNPNAFYGLQNEIRKLQERGVLGGQPGALSETTASTVRNPISYAANVRTAEAALKQATDAAPSNSLAQFANVIAGTKSPEDKVKLLQQRLVRTTDPAEAQYLTDFIEPLTRFGAKSK